MDLGEPAGNVARILGLLLMLVAIPAVFHAGRLRTPGSNAVGGAGLLSVVLLLLFLDGRACWRRSTGCAATFRK